jgi:hypothetical protein
MDLVVPTGTQVHAAFDGHVTVFKPHTPSSDSEKVYGAQLFMRSDNNMMGGFYTHFTGGTFSVGQTIDRGARLGVTLKNHLHLALVEIIGGLPGGRYMGVDIFKDFLKMVGQPTVVFFVNFKQDGSPPDVTPTSLPAWLPSKRK